MRLLQYIRMDMPHGDKVTDAFHPSHKVFSSRLNMDDRSIRLALRKIIACLTSRHRLVYLGELSLTVGVGLDRTEMLIQYLCDQDIVRYATAAEKKSCDLAVGGVVLTLVSGADLTGINDT